MLAGGALHLAPVEHDTDHVVADGAVGGVRADEPAIGRFACVVVDVGHSNPRQAAVRQDRLWKETRTVHRYGHASKSIRALLHEAAQLAPPTGCCDHRSGGPAVRRRLTDGGLDVASCQRDGRKHHQRRR